MPAGRAPVALAICVLLVGCSSDPFALKVPQRITGESTPSPSVSAEQLNALTYRIELTEPTVVAGGEATYVLTVRNDSGGPITIPSCDTGIGRRGIVPVDDPGAELWMQLTYDCGGPQVFGDGDEESWTETVYAHDMYGTPYEPGEYLVGRRVPGDAGRLLVPITVTEAAPG